MTNYEILNSKAEESRAEYINDRELSDLKAKYIKEGYESCLREVKARVGSVECLEDENHTNSSYFRGFNDCLDEIKKLIENV